MQIFMSISSLSWFQDIIPDNRERLRLTKAIPIDSGSERNLQSLFRGRSPLHLPRLGLLQRHVTTHGQSCTSFDRMNFCAWYVDDDCFHKNPDDVFHRKKRCFNICVNKLSISHFSLEIGRHARHTVKGPKRPEEVFSLARKARNF